VKVIATEKGFYKGVFIKPMTEFEFDGKKCGKWFVPVEDQPKIKTVTSDEGPTATEIKAQLSAAGVDFRGNASRVELLALLEETMKKFNPAGSDAPDKSLQNL
jgi:hypothetical protein